MASRFIGPFFDAGNGIQPEDGAKLFFFVTGTSTPKNTFSDSAGTIPNTNPVIADSNGLFSDIFITGTYKVVLEDKNGVQIWEADPVDEFETTKGSALSISTLQTRLNPDTLAIAIADATLEVDDVLSVEERSAGNGGGGIWDVVLKGTTPDVDLPNTFDIVASTGDATLALVLRIENEIDLTAIGVGTRPFNPTPTGLANSADAYQRAIDIAFSKGAIIRWRGDFLCEKEVTIPKFGVTIIGGGRQRSRIISNGSHIVHKFTTQAVFKNFSVVNSSGTKQGFAFSTPQDNDTDSQAVACTWENISCTEFYNSWWLRTSLYCTWSYCFSKSLVGLRLARNSNPFDRGVDQANGGWNSFSPLGFFHNVGKVDTCVFEDVEAGVWGSPMIFDFISVNCQRQTGAPAGNLCIPITEARTGLWITSGTDGTRNTWVIKISDYYAEACDRPIFLLDQSTVIIDTVFSQGGPSGDRADVALELNNSFAIIESWVGQDFYDNKIKLTNNSKLIGRVGGVAASLDSNIDATSIHFEKTNQEEFKAQYTFTTNATGSQLLPDTLLDRSHYRLSVAALFNGSSVSSGIFHVYRHTTSGTTQVIALSAVSSNFNVTISGAQISINTVTANQMDYVIFFERKTESITDPVAL